MTEALGCDSVGSVVGAAGGSVTMGWISGIWVAGGTVAGGTVAEGSVVGAAVSDEAAVGLPESEAEGAVWVNQKASSNTIPITISRHANETTGVQCFRMPLPVSRFPHLAQKVECLSLAVPQCEQKTQFPLENPSDSQFRESREVHCPC